MDFWTDLLIDFWKVFGAILALKINEKSIKKLRKNLIDFLMAF